MPNVGSYEPFLTPMRTSKHWTTTSVRELFEAV